MTAILEKARQATGLSAREFLELLAGPDADREVQEAADFVRRRVFGRRVRVFAPIYLSNLCVNECLYCGFRVRNRHAARKTLSEDELHAEAAALVSEGHAHLLLVSGEVPAVVDEEYLARCLAVLAGFPEIRRVDLEIGPLPARTLSRLAREGFHTFVLYQETYDRPTYERWHVFGPKRDYDRRFSAAQEALSCGWAGAGLGVLLGLSADWRRETAALFAQARDLQARFQVAPGLSLPRLRPADALPAEGDTFPVADRDFARALACLRLGMPDCEITVSTREEPAFRDTLLSFGVSSVSAGSRTNPGGYGAAPGSTGQFEIADERPTAEVLGALLRAGLDPFPARARTPAARELARR